MGALTRQSPSSLTSRDLELLSFLGKYGFASAEAIHRKFWPGQTGRCHFRRIGTLKERGLIEPLRGDAGHQIGYRLTKRGLALVLGENAANKSSESFRAAFQTNFCHDDLLVQIGAVLESVRGVSHYRNEVQARRLLTEKHGHSERKADGFKVPDALFDLRTNEGTFRVALELERTLKSRKRYALHCRRWITSFDFNLVFVIARDVKIMGRYRRVLAHVRANDPIVKFSKRNNGIYFALLDDVLKTGANAKFFGEGDEFSIAQIARHQQTPGATA